MPSLISAIRGDEAATDYLTWPGEFELDRAKNADNVRLESGERLESFAGDGAGGRYFFCGEGGEERPVLFADSEGSAALIAIGLRELLQLLLVAPWWHSCLNFTADESHELAAEYLEDMPDLYLRRDRAAVALGIDLPPEADALARLHEVATNLGADFTLVFTPSNLPYRPLITRSG
ncbi:hypothetical protein [Streptomyces sp. NPDC088733]|uniref:hypothetical protein n=1 Tax=Streptomyces sp. NPDC088733 TaxID=3365880 RepID=UPI00382836E5